MKNKKLWIIIGIVISIIGIIVITCLSNSKGNNSNNSSSSNVEKPPFFDGKYTIFATDDGRGVYLTFFEDNKCFTNFYDFDGSYSLGRGEKISIGYDTNMCNYSYVNHIITITCNNFVRMNYTYSLGTGQIQTATLQSHPVISRIQYEYNEEDDTMTLVSGEWHYEQTYNGLLYIYFMTEEESEEYKKHVEETGKNEVLSNEEIKQFLEEERAKEKEEVKEPEKEKESINVQIEIEKKETIRIKFFLYHPEDINRITINGEAKSYEYGNNEYTLEPIEGNNNIQVSIEYQDGTNQKINKEVLFTPETPEIFVREFDGGCTIILSSRDNYSSANEASYNTLDQMEIFFDNEAITTSSNIKDSVTISQTLSNYFHPVPGTHTLRYRNKYGKEGTKEIVIPDSCS